MAEQDAGRYPCIVVEGNTVRLIGTMLLVDGRYRLVRVDEEDEDNDG